MTQGFQRDELAEFAHSVELAAALTAWRDAEARAKELGIVALRAGCRAHIVAEQLGMSRRTFYRWLDGAR